MPVLSDASDMVSDTDDTPDVSNASIHPKMPEMNPQYGATTFSTNHDNASATTSITFESMENIGTRTVPIDVLSLLMALFIPSVAFLYSSGAAKATSSDILSYIALATFAMATAAMAAIAAPTATIAPLLVLASPFMELPTALMPSRIWPN